jgi:S-adenosylmethionine decarboxylase
MIGKHVLADFYGVASAPLDDAGLLSRCLRSAAEKCQLTALADPVIHCFEGGGVTGFILLAESHISLHTYPEKGFIALDIFSCGKEDPEAALSVFREALHPKTENVTTATRGNRIF